MANGLELGRATVRGGEYPQFALLAVAEPLNRFAQGRQPGNFEESAKKFNAVGRVELAPKVFDQGFAWRIGE